MKSTPIIAVVIASACLAFNPAHADVSSIPTGVGVFPGTDRTVGYGISDDGNVVSGISVTGPTALGFRWTRSGGLQDIGTLGGDSTAVRAASADGSVLVGISRLTNAPSGDPSHAFRWTPAGGMQDLGTLGGTISDAEGVSANGQVIVGMSMLSGNTTSRAFSWTQAGGMHNLGTLAGGSNSAADAASADGSVIVGSAQVGSSGTAVRWVNGAISDLGTLGGTSAYASAVSADGSVIAGNSATTGNVAYHPFVWSNNLMTDIGVLSGGTYAYATGISGDGSIVIGYSDTSGSIYPHVFRWTRATGMQDIVTLMTNAGVNLNGYELAFANAISSNGKYFTGEALFPDGTDEAFVACYDPAGSCVGVTTPSSQASSVQTLAADQRALLIESRATADQLLGTMRPIDDTTYIFGGYMFDGGVGYAGGQYASHGFTVLGGIAYGSQDYPHISQKGAFTVAAALRYAFADLLGDKVVYPYVEAGGWGTPRTTLDFTRIYANGSGRGMGQGETRGSLWAGYLRSGLVWEAGPHDQFVGYGEWAQQYLGFDTYSEAQALGNPFPAAVDGGLLRVNVARAGASWTHKLDNLLGAPVSVTLNGAVATSFAVHARLNTNIAALGPVAAANQADSWGEFGARVEARVTEHLAVDANVTGTAGGGEIGTSVHGAVGLTYRF